MPPIKPKPLAAQLQGVAPSPQPWDDPSLRPQPSPTPPGQPIAAEATPQPADEAIGLAQELEALRTKFKNLIPEWLWNSPPPVKKK